jgi:hypothetical protein
MTPSAWRGLFRLIGFTMFVIGAFAFDAGWDAGGTALLLVGLLFALSPHKEHPND